MFKLILNIRLGGCLRLMAPIKYHRLNSNIFWVPIANKGELIEKHKATITRPEIIFLTDPTL